MDSGLIAYHYSRDRFRINDPYNIAEPLAPAKWGNLTLSQTFFDNLVTLYFGIKNFSDLQYAIIGTKSAPSVSDPLGTTVPPLGIQIKARTYYGGLKANMDFDRMKVPTIADLNRMQKRIYGSLGSAVDGVYGWGARIESYEVLGTDQKCHEWWRPRGGIGLENTAGFCGHDSGSFIIRDCVDAQADPPLQKCAIQPSETPRTENQRSSQPECGLELHARINR